MGTLWTGETGTPLREIIGKLGNKSYAKIWQRCRWIDRDGVEQDDFFGACSYDAGTGRLEALDYDCYSLNDLFESWEETTDNDGNPALVVWERGYLEE